MVKTYRISAPMMAGLLLALLGILVAVRWIFLIDGIAVLIPGSEHMGIVNPMLFLAAGFCFFACTRSGDESRSVRTTVSVCVTALIVFPLAYLFESLTDLSLGVDFVRVGTVATLAIPHPGRISPNASMGYLLTGVAFWLLRRPASLPKSIALTVLVIAIAGIGVGGLVGYFIGLENLYQIASFNRMLPTTAFGLSVIAIGLWNLQDTSEPLRSTAAGAVERRIARRSWLVIALVALGGGVAGFAVLRDTFEKSVSQSLLLTATTNAASLASSLEASLWFPRTVATRPTVRETLVKLGADPDDVGSSQYLQKIADSFLTAGLTGVEFIDGRGVQAARAGELVRPAALVLQRIDNAGQVAYLAWKDGHLLVTENDVVVDGIVVGRVRTEQRLKLFDGLLADMRALNESSDVVICSAEGDSAICAPTRFRPVRFELSLSAGDGEAGLPLARALRGERGVLYIRDGRGTRALAAFAPIGGYGLGLAVKTDVRTLYAPLQSRLNVLLLALAGMIGVGVYFQRSQVRPMVQRLVASEERVKAILEDQSEFVSVAKPDGELTYVNPAYARRFSRPASRLVGANLFDFIEPADREAVRKRVDEVLASGKVATGENRMTAEDGSERWVAWTNSLQRGGQGQLFLHSVGRDVTERRRSEMALRTSQAFLARTGRVAGIGGWELELATGVVTWSEETRRIHEVGEDFTPTLESAVAFYAPPARAVLEQAIARAIKDGSAWDLELPFVTAKGRNIWVRAQGEVELEAQVPVRLVGAFQDVTERLATERALRELTEIFDSTSDFVVQADRRGNVHYLNPAVRRALKLAVDEPARRFNFAEFNTPETNQRFVTEIVPAATQTGVWIGETTVLVDNKRVLPVNHMVIAHRDSEGRVSRYSAVMRDISGELEARQQLLRQTATLRSVTEAIPAMVGVVGLDGRYRFVNSAFERWVGARRDSLVGQSMEQVLGQDEHQRSLPWINRALAGETVEFDRSYPRRRSASHLRISYIPVWNAGQLDGFVGVALDISQHKQEEVRLQQLAQRDALTGLLNRAGFERYLESRWVHDNADAGECLALLYVDLDHFKPVNDAHGHPVGDQVLQQFGERLLKLVRPTDAVARLGGDEFALALPMMRDSPGAPLVADKVLAAAKAPFEIGSLSIRVGASIGIAFGSATEEGWADLVARADSMLYRAKAAGRGRHIAQVR